MHRDYAVPALEAGCHVLLEKPMAVSVAECEAINAAAQASGAKLMLAYRLHFEPGTLDAIARVRAGAIGEPRMFTATFGQTVSAGNHRAKQGFWAGPVPDMGTYPINAARNLFGEEPVEVSALGSRRPDSPYAFDGTVAVTLRFPSGRLAQFTVSYETEGVDAYRITGTEGDLHMQPGFLFGTGLEAALTRGGETERLTYPSVDQFGGQTRYFSECILNDRAPEPDGEEGLCDLRVLEAVERALATGRTQSLDPMSRSRRPEPSQATDLPAVEPPEMVNAARPTPDPDKHPQQCVACGEPIKSETVVFARQRNRHLRRATRAPEGRGEGIMAKHDILGFFEHRRDGAWVCVRPFTLTTPNASVDIRQGMRFDYGKRIGGVDLAEYLERLGSQFGS